MPECTLPPPSMLFPFLDRSLLDDHTASVSRWLVRSLASVLLLAPPPPHHDSSPEGGRGRGEAYDGQTDGPTTKEAVAPHAIVKPLSHSPSVAFFFLSFPLPPTRPPPPPHQHFSSRLSVRPSPLRSPFKVVFAAAAAHCVLSPSPHCTLALDRSTGSGGGAVESSQLLSECRHRTSTTTQCTMAAAVNLL